MLSQQNNRLLVETGPGTPMGRLMREYWIPVLRSAQLTSGAAPHRLKIMGQRLIAFRSPEGRVGVMDEACPHRGASLALGRNEKCGLRCVYHGWKIAPSGELLEAPTHPENFALSKLTTRAHPVHEAQGIVWTWLGKGKAPPFRKLAFSDLPHDHVFAATVVCNCNWLQPLETLWDVFHAQILHNQTNRRSRRGGAYFSTEGRTTDSGLRFDYPEMLVEATPYGFSYTNSDSAKRTHFRFIMPFIQHHAIEPGPNADRGLQISVPIDDNRTLLWMIFFNRTTPLKPDGFAMQGMGRVPDLNDFVRHRGPRTAENRWGQNREAMESGESFSGVLGESMLVTIFGEDLMAIESQGQVDRSAEQLAPTDRALAYGRRRILEALSAYERGEAPLGRDLDLTGVESLFEVKEHRDLETVSG